MPIMETIRKVVLLPNEYMERMIVGHFEAEVPRRDTIPEFQKPLIYVTYPDNMEDEIWVPPVQEDNVTHQLDEDSDDGKCSCSETLYEIGTKETLARESTTNAYELNSSYEKPVVEMSEMWFHRTGWQNRGVYSSDDKSSKMAYHVDIPWRECGTSLTIRRDGSTGEIVAESHRKGPGRPFEITFSDPNQRPFLSDDGKLVLKFGCIYSRSHNFNYRGRNLAWKHGLACRILRDLNTAEILAEFHSKALNDRDGKMVIMGEYAKDPLWVDVIITSALSCQQREREIRRRAGSSGGSGECGSYC